MSVTSQQATQELQEQVVSDLQRYMTQNPQLAEELMKVIVSQYNNPKKISQVQEGIRQMYDIKTHDTSVADGLRSENKAL